LLVFINGADLEIQRDVARRLVSRFERALIIDSEPPPELAARITRERERGIETFLVAEVFSTWSRLRATRRALASIEATSFAYRLQADFPTLTAEGRKLQETQIAEARCGDLGLVVRCESEDQTAAFVEDDLREPVHLAPWDPRFPSRFEEERRAIERALAGLVLGVEHIGSTAVEGLWAKPILDIAVTVPKLEDTCRYIPPLAELGYNFCDYPTNLERHFFRKGRPRTHHLHLGEPGASDLRDQMRFRDALRADRELRHRYLAMKRDLAGRHGADRARYSEAKGAFVAAALGG